MVEDTPMGEEERALLKLDLQQAGFDVTGAGEGKLRKLVERLGAWTTKLSKRQRRNQD